ncbi:MAG TPA: complex I NDUFA9 subunit family protein [Candidatus Limnocylindria bacterium]|nr:complex I NDUFA9 subunit family protein [Candidatus Limnocylindria bacterium]
MKIAVTGATGFVGSHLVPQLVAGGHEIIAISRVGRRLTDWGEAVTPQAVDVTTGDLDAAFDGADAVVHLVAIPREGRGRRFEDVNVTGTRRVVAAAERAGVRRLVHQSVLGATDDHRHAYLSSKWRAEEAVRASALDWVILRPSLLFGPGDGFFRLVRTTLRWWSPGFVVVPGRGDTRFQPLSVDDMAVAIERSVVDPERPNSTLELGGPRWMTYRQILDAVMAATGMHRWKLGMPVSLLSAVTAVTDRILPVFPVSHDQVGSLSLPNSTELDAFERAFGIRPREVDLSYLGRPDPAG